MYLNSDGILDVDLDLAGIDSGRDVIAGFERQLVASKLCVETGQRWGCPNQTQSGATRTQTFTNKLRTTTWTCEKVRESKKKVWDVCVRKGRQGR